jgi:hypothetical protein
VLGNGKGMIANRLTIPTRHTGEATGNVFDLYIKR